MEQDAQALNGGWQSPFSRIGRAVRRGLRITRTLTVVLVLAASLAANAALFAGGVLHNVVFGTLENVTGLATETSRLRKERDDLRNENRRLNGRMNRLRGATDTAVKRTARRSANAVGRAVVTAPGKALPVVGTGVIVGITALEIKDICDTIKDMKEIERVLDLPESSSEEERQYCGMTEVEIWNEVDAIKVAPGAAWERSRAFLGGLNPLTPQVLAGIGDHLDRLWDRINPSEGWQRLRSLVE